jgi:hypothetical protein
VPIVIEIPERINLAKATFQFDFWSGSPTMTGFTPGSPPRFGDGNVRIWTKDGDQPRSANSIHLGGNLVMDGTYYTAQQLGFTDNNRTITLYVEGHSLSSSFGNREIIVNMDYNLNGQTVRVEDRVKYTVTEDGLWYDNWYISSKVIDAVAFEPLCIPGIIAAGGTANEYGTFRIYKHPGDASCSDNTYPITVEFTLNDYTLTPGQVLGVNNTDYIVMANNTTVPITKVNGVDTGSVVIPAGQDYVDVYIQALDDNDSDEELVYLNVTRAYSTKGLVADKFFNVGNTGGDYVVIKDEGWAVKSVEWESSPYGNDLFYTWTGRSVYADQNTPNVVGNDYLKMNVVVAIEGFLPTGGGTVNIGWIDPPNASGTGAANYTQLGLSTTSLTFYNNNLTQTVTSTVGMHPGDNYIVKATANNGKLNNTVYSEILTVWRRFWLELDQMEAPDPLKLNQYGINVDGFHASKEYHGTFTDANGIPIEGLWARPGTPLHAPEPRNFDVLFQPPKPDPSILIRAMHDACVSVIVVDETQFRKWYPQPAPFREKMAFKHNMSNDSAINNNQLLSEIRGIGNQTRDLPVTDLGFMCGQGIGGYEPYQHESNDTHIVGNVTGFANKGYTYPNPNVFMLFQETIRDIVSTDNTIKRTELEINQLVTFHEFLHWYGFVDTLVANVPIDGSIMGKDWYTSNTIDAYLKLSSTQIKKIQAFV